MSFYLVVDFETTGVGKDATKRYKSYSYSRMPLPRANYPVQLVAELLDASYSVLQSKQMLIRGCERLDPWVLENCPHLSVNATRPTKRTFKKLLARIPDGSSLHVTHRKVA